MHVQDLERFPVLTIVQSFQKLVQREISENVCSFS